MAPLLSLAAPARRLCPGAAPRVAGLAARCKYLDRMGIPPYGRRGRMAARHALVAAILCVLGAAAAPANGAATVGISDQNLDALTDQLFLWTGIRTVRM